MAAVEEAPERLQAVVAVVTVRQAAAVQIAIAHLLTLPVLQAVTDHLSALGILRPEAIVHL